MILEQLEDGESNVVDVAEAGSLGLLGVVETSGPVDSNVGGLLVQLHRRCDGSTYNRCNTLTLKSLF